MLYIIVAVCSNCGSEEVSSQSSVNIDTKYTYYNLLGPGSHFVDESRDMLCKLNLHSLMVKVAVVGLEFVKITQT